MHGRGKPLGLGTLGAWPWETPGFGNAWCMAVGNPWVWEFPLGFILHHPEAMSGTWNLRGDIIESVSSRKCKSTVADPGILEGGGGGVRVSKEAGP